MSKGESTEEMSTAEVAELLELPVSKLQFWVREGRLTPRSQGQGKKKRLFWSVDDLAQARSLKNGKGRSRGQEALARVVPETFWSHLPQAVIRAQSASDGEIVICGPDGIRVLRDDTPLSQLVTRPGLPSLILKRP